MNSSSYVPAGPEAAPSTQTSTITPQSSSTDLSPTSTVLIALFSSLFGLAAIAVAICWIRRRGTTTMDVVDEPPLKKATVGDIEALAATRPIIPITPLGDVRWKPQIRSISGPAPDEDLCKKPASLHPKRTRSPPPFNHITPQFLDSCPKSAPAYALSFPHNEASCLEKSLREDVSPVTTPRALAVSGMQTRSWEDLDSSQRTGRVDGG